MNHPIDTARKWLPFEIKHMSDIADIWVVGSTAHEIALGHPPTEVLGLFESDPRDIDVIINPNDFNRVFKFLRGTADLDDTYEGGLRFYINEKAVDVWPGTVESYLAELPDSVEDAYLYKPGRHIVLHMCKTKLKEESHGKED